MPFVFEKLPIFGAYKIKPHIFCDNRGAYKKIYSKDDFYSHNIFDIFNESSDLISQKGSIRGLHYQQNYSQAKLIHVIKGSLYDAFVDLRKDSPTYLKHFEIRLSAEDNIVIFIPEGCAHGFMALEDDTIFSYQCSGKYDPCSCGGIIWNDPDLNIGWPLKEGLIITEKDKNWPTLNEFLNRGND